LLEEITPLSPMYRLADDMDKMVQYPTDGVAWSVYRSVTIVSPARTAEPIEMPFAGYGLR